MTIPNILTLEIDITYTCGLRCPNCNRLTDLKPGSPSEWVSVEQIRQLINESKACKYPWRKWWPIGGEPTTHPELIRLLELIAHYRDWRGLAQFQVGIATHGFQVQAILQEVQAEYPFVEILNSHKVPGEPRDFVAVLDAAIDRLPSLPSEPHGCGVSWRCGISMNYAGFFPCCVAGAMYRVAKIGYPLRNVQDITIEAIRQQYRAYCPLCGYFVRESRSRATRISSTWQRILRDAELAATNAKQ